MEYDMRCPICGKENKRTYYSEDFGVVEYYYSCSRCGYNSEMCYSPVHDYIDLVDGWDFELLKQAWKGDRE